MSRILVWDLPTRLAHWLMAGSFAVAYASGDSERWRDVHVIAGYLFAAVIAFRLVWGLVGTRYARFSSFVKPPAAAAGYVLGLLTRRPQHWTGHNPAGGYAILAMLVLGALAATAGMLNYAEIGGDLFEEAHEALANAMLVVVVVHLAGVAVGSLSHGENLPLAMLTGYKSGDPSGSIRGQQWISAAVLLAWLWLAVAWLRQMLG